MNAQSANIATAAFLLLAACIYLAFRALIRSDIAYMVGAIAAAAGLGFAAGALTTVDSCTVSLETMNACATLGRICEQAKIQEEDTLAEAKKRIIRYA